jgi:hypothetical protein
MVGHDDAWKLGRDEMEGTPTFAFDLLTYSTRGQSMGSLSARLVRVPPGRP